MTSEVTTITNVKKAVHGDLNAFAALLRDPAAMVLDGEAIPGYTLTPSAVRRVLTALRQGTAAPSVVQQWASFVRRGYIAGELPVRSITIDYDPQAEDTIADVVSRLDEIGDTVDGEVSSDEIGEMLASLSG